jgi:hypothetical protein
MKMYPAGRGEVQHRRAGGGCGAVATSVPGAVRWTDGAGVVWGSGSAARARGVGFGPRKRTLVAICKTSTSETPVDLLGRLQRRDPAGNKRGLHLADRIIDGDAIAFVEQFDGEDLAGSRRAILVGERQGDIKGQHLVGVPGER